MHLTLLAVFFTFLTISGGNSYYTGGACPHNCRCTARVQDRSSHLRRMYMSQWIQSMYRYGQKKDYNKQTNTINEGREMLCLGLQRLPYFIPPDLIKLQIYGGKRGLRRLAESGIRNDDARTGRQTSLDNRVPISYYQISTLTRNAFSRSRQLQELSITGNRIKRLQPGDFEMLTNLEKLTLRKNKIKGVEEKTFRDLVSLERLDLGDNRLRKIKRDLFHDVINLKELKLKRNRLKVLHPDTLARLSKLRVLDLSQNSLRDLERDMFLKNRDLQELNLAGNQFRKIRPEWMQALPNLKSLDLSDNNMGVIPANIFAPLPSLRYLNLAGNNITNVFRNAFTPVKHLEKLDLSRNKLRYIAAFSFADLQNLRDLRLYQNHIEMLAKGTFTGLKKLQVLSLANNNIKELQNTSFVAFKHLKKFDVSHNKIRYIKMRTLSGLLNLRDLDISHNEISKVEDEAFAVSLMNHYSKITWLDLEGNKIDMLTSKMFVGVPHVKSMDLSHNLIKEVEQSAFKSMKGLHNLKLNGNIIGILKPGVFKDLKMLRNLDMSYNKLPNITSNTLQGLKSTEEVDFSNNRISYVAEDVLADVPKLMKLDLSGNKLSRVATKMFQTTHSLRNINLANNSMLLFEVNSNHEYKLNSLDLSDNNIREISSVILAWMGPNGTVGFSGNPWSCNCRMQWLGDALRKSNLNYPKVDQVTCKVPQGMAGRKINTMTISDFVCDTQTPPSNEFINRGRYHIGCPANKSPTASQKPILEQWHVTVFDKYKNPVCGGVRIEDNWVLTHASCWLNKSINALHIANGDVLMKAGGTHRSSRGAFRVANVYFHPRMSIIPTLEVSPLALVRIRPILPNLAGRPKPVNTYPCIRPNLGSVVHDKSYFLTAKDVTVKPATRVKIKTLSLIPYRDNGYCDGMRFICVKNSRYKFSPHNFNTDGAPMYSTQDFSLVAIRSMRISPYNAEQRFVGLSEFVPWIEKTLAQHAAE
ncbi:insulin-like growth factor-binding protein complex acid labile subunit [Lineus longissimus]|uniref:insulin-like growth factor-binding protein complex acid labile subunit n=1 Tax=Lineus longissimus TaxID=88925 RepID=UPI002B4D2849